MEKRKTRRFAAGHFILILAAVLLIYHCNRHENIAGKYRAVDNGTHKHITATLELKANGKGLWSIETDNAPFRWDLRQNTIRLHTRSGGVIEGTVDHKTIQIALPGTGVILFEHIN